MAATTTSPTATSPTTTSPTTSSARCETTTLSDEIHQIAAVVHRSHYLMVHASAAFADSDEWVAMGSPTPALRLSQIADVEVSTAREWIRVGRRVRKLAEMDDAFRTRRLSYAKVRTLTRFATPENESELVALAEGVPASHLNRTLALWFAQNTTPEELEDHQHRQRSMRWRTEPDGMVSFHLRLPPHLAAILIALLTGVVRRSKPAADASGAYPTVAQQQADALTTLITEGAGTVETEVVLHVRGDGCTTDDGTPISDTVMERIAPDAFLRALIHDAEGRPVNASSRRRHPTGRQKRVVKERDRVCVDCGDGGLLLQFDHVPDHRLTKHTVTDELELRCAPCHQRRHELESAKASDPRRRRAS